MQLLGEQLLAALRTTTSTVKWLAEDFATIGVLSPEQAILMVQSGQFTGGGSGRKVRYIKFTPKKMTPAEKSFCQIHELPTYDPTYFRTFAGFLQDQSSFPDNRRRVKRMR